MKKQLNLIFTIDEKYIQHFTVTLTSVIENNRDQNITVFVVHSIVDLTLLNKVVAFFSDKYSINLSLLSLDNSLFDKYAISHHISKAVYFRLIVSDLIPDNVGSAIYLDSDIIVTGSLKELIDFDFKDKYLYAVNDVTAEKESVIRLNEMGVPAAQYFNSGVMLLNLKLWKANNIAQKLILTAEKYWDKLLWWDQDVLNIFFHDKWGQLPYKYNANARTKQLNDMPVIIHYTSSSKPWHYLNNNPYKKQYWKYLHLTPYKNYKYKDLTLKNFVKRIIFFNKEL